MASFSTIIQNKIKMDLEKLNNVGRNYIGSEGDEKKKSKESYIRTLVEVESHLREYILITYLYGKTSARIDNTIKKLFKYPYSPTLVKELGDSLVKAPDSYIEVMSIELLVNKNIVEQSIL